MKNNPLKQAFLLTCIALVTGRLTSYSGGFFSAGYTGSPGSNGANCTTCHSGSPVTVAQGGITSNIPVTGYIPGQSYTITVTAQHPTFNTFGFMLTAESTSGVHVGSWTLLNATETQLTAGGQYVAHTSAGISGSNNSKAWTVQWTAPSPGVGTVIFYASINRANGDFTTSGDQIQTASLSVAQFNPPPPPPPVNLKIDTVLHEVCLAGCNGSIQVSYTGGVPPVSLTITGGTFTGLCSGQYLVKATDSIGQVDSVWVTIQAGSNPDTPGVVYDQTNALLYTTSQASGYEWLYFGQSIPGSNNDTLSLQGLQPGEYQVRVFDSLACSTTSDIFTVIFGNTKERHQYSLRIYPNPVPRRSDLYVHYDGPPAEVSLFHVSGTLIETISVHPGINRLNTESLNPGTYILVIFYSRNQKPLISKFSVL